MNGSIKFFKIFVVEDDIWYREMISHHLTLNPDHIISKYSTASDCLKNMHKNPDLVTIDLSLPDLSGDILFQKIKDICPETSVIIL
ncbi:MAG: response regulator, partial [bacterium]